MPGDLRQHRRQQRVLQRARDRRALAVQRARCRPRPPRAGRAPRARRAARARASRPDSAVDERHHAEPLAAHASSARSPPSARRAARSASRWRRVERGARAVRLVDVAGAARRGPCARPPPGPTRAGRVDRRGPASRSASSARAGSAWATATRSRPRSPSDVDHAPVGEVGHREPRDAAQRLLVVERAGEHAAGLGQQPLRLLGLLEVGDVLDHVDRLRDACRPARAAAAP